MAEEYGGGMGLWISECLDASAFGGISFWVRGNAPADSAVLTLLMEETTSSTPSTPDALIGTCPGEDETCVAPTHTFPVTETWTEIRVAWSSFTIGSAAGSGVAVDGHDIWQIQFDIGLEWVPGDSDYEPVAAPYELAIDDISFY